MHVATSCLPEDAYAMDYSQLDKVRREAVPLQLDTIEAFVAGRLSRREFIKRGTVLGLSMGSISMVIAACSGTTSSAAPSGGAGASGAAGGTIRIAIQKPVKVDPVAMQDLGGYGITSQCFEFLCTLTPKNLVDIGPGLATKWTPNADGTVWTFDLRQNVKWQDGSAFTAADVVATMERLVDGRQLRAQGRPRPGRRGRDQRQHRDVHPARGERQLPVPRLGLQRPDADHPEGLRGRHDAGREAQRHRRVEAQELQRADRRVVRQRNDTWWGGKTPLDGLEFIFFDATGPMVTAYQGKQVDAIVQFDVLSGKSLFDDANFSLIAAPAALHRQIWMRTDTGPFKDKRVRQALALTFDRPALIQQLFQGKAQLGNDHLIWEGYPYFDSSVPQRAQNIDKAKALLAEANATNLTATLHAGQLLEIPDLAALLKSQAAPAGITLNVAIESLEHLLRRPVVPGEAGRSALLRRRRARHRRLRPSRDAGRLPQRGPQVEGHLELVAVRFDGVRRCLQVSSRPRSASTPRRRPATRSRRSSSRTSRSACRTSTTTSPATRSRSPAPYASGLGQMFFSSTSKVA